MLVSPEQILVAFLETIEMVSISFIFSVIIGVPLGIIIVITKENHIASNKVINKILNFIVNIVRSIPFIILLVAIIPITRFIVGTSIGTKAAIVPLVFYCSPYIARLIENSILEVDFGVIESAKAMGATPLQIIKYFLIPESSGSIILSLTTAIIGLIGASAMAGVVGGGGIGDLAITYGYNRFDTVTMVITVVILIIMVQIVQVTGNYLAKKIGRR